MNIFEQYGIKEVADCTLYSIHRKKDGSGELYYVPALYLDTLKISTVEKTAENVWATGGLGNARLINWDFGKTINVNLEDALCTPALLGMCWGGVLSADWKDTELEHDYGISFNNKNPVERIARMEKAFYPRNDRENGVIGKLIPLTAYDKEDTIGDLPVKSSVIDGTKIDGFGYVKNRPYHWYMKIESGAKSIGVVPNKIFDNVGKAYKVDTSKIVVSEMPTQSSGEEYKFSVIYLINPTEKITKTYNEQIVLTKENVVADAGLGVNLKNAKFLRILVDNNNNYSAQLSKGTAESPDALWKLSDWSATDEVDLELFKGIDMWLKFDSINEMTYFLLTKYEKNISYIGTRDIDYSNKKADLNEAENETDVDKTTEGRLWAYVSPKSMKPFDDDYWFSQGEPYFIKSLTLATKEKKLKAHTIRVTAGQFPGMYMLVGETYIRDRDTGKDERLQLKFPLAKVRSEQTLTLQADGDPTTFNMALEIARPENGIMMEITPYEVADTMIQNSDGTFSTEVKDGSTTVLSE